MTREGWSQVTCHYCGGHGAYAHYYQDGSFDVASCPTCGGAGVLWLHEASRRLALWPGGPFAGRA